MTNEELNEHLAKAYVIVREAQAEICDPDIDEKLENIIYLLDEVDSLMQELED